MADLNKFLGSGKNLTLHEQRDRIREASDDELRDALESAEMELLNLRTQAMMQQMSNPMRIRQVRKMVARVHTEVAARASKAAA